jgi:outer membrane protein OmpA-like peptidoglycan-associated protein
MAAGFARPQGSPAAPNYAQLMAEGQKLQEAERWEEALARYREAAGTALDLTQAARAQFKVAQTLERVQDPDAALLWYRYSLERYHHPDTEAAIKRLQGERFDRVVMAPEITRGLKLPPTRSRGIAVSIDLPVNFGFDKDTLTDQGNRQVAELARALADPVFGNDRFVVVGHTDKRGSDQYNQSLSERRARRVRDVLRGQFQFEPSRFDVVGMGKRQLLFLGDMEEDHRLNRRVEVQRLPGALTPHVNPTSQRERYAVVIGSSKYPNILQRGGRAVDLEGARPDAERMAEILTRYGYSRDNMTVLLDSDATRSAILDAIDHVAALVTHGDHVLIYYSGHGTSSFDPKTGGFGMQPATGAIIPSDIHPGSRDSVLAQLVIGSRDLRPRLLRLEEKADVVVIFDACFSGESVKSMRGGDAPALRYVSLADLTSGGISSDGIEAAERSLFARSLGEDYPYRKVVYLSAAASNQYACDITRRVLERLRGRFSTVDGLPHGAFTNALLKLLAGGGSAAPPSCHDFYQRVARVVHDQGLMIGFKQDPQLLYPSSKSETAEQPCFVSR